MRLHSVERRGGFGVVVFGQAFDLLDVENGVAFHVGDFALDVLAGRVVMLGAGDGCWRRRPESLSRPCGRARLVPLAWRKVIQIGAAKPCTMAEARATEY